MCEALGYKGFWAERFFQAWLIQGGSGWCTHSVSDLWRLRRPAVSSHACVVKRVEFTLENHSPPERVYYEAFLDILGLPYAYFLPSVSRFEAIFQHSLKLADYSCLLVQLKSRLCGFPSFHWPLHRSRRQG